MSQLTHSPPLHVKNTGGFTLLEVLVALSILTVGLLGLAMLQTVGMRFNTNSYSRTQATYLAYDIAERMRANPQGFTAGNYDITTLSAANTVVGGTAYTCNTSNNCACDTATCNAAALAAYDLGQWYYRQDNLIAGAKDAANSTMNCTNPNGIASRRATIQRVGNVATITLCWFEQESNSTSTTSLKSQAWQVEIY